jgi:hypothetical protein
MPDIVDKGENVEKGGSVKRQGVVKREWRKWREGRAKTLHTVLMYSSFVQYQTYSCVN